MRLLAAIVLLMLASCSTCESCNTCKSCDDPVCETVTIDEGIPWGPVRTACELGGYPFTTGEARLCRQPSDATYGGEPLLRATLTTERGECTYYVAYPESTLVPGVVAGTQID